MKNFIPCLILVLSISIVSGCSNEKIIENKSAEISKNDYVQTEQEKMFATAREYIAQYSTPGMKVDLKISRQLDKRVLLNVVPVNIETDEAGVIMEKVGNTWEGRAFGTIFPEWEEKVPDLFK
jgi:hypothetical protein|tara:strand:+ start:5730 stop:6098 length:369 start_codon:yes stop_codon:yes gene_type:complete